mmetsp:Transcript_5639/g.8310  ORF Transcript_5639/g.8310 Transcript_5639/m.8310 type:complete len:319 (+) Transcript_5639:72-1028(+)|eukprot:CAMPEP_0167752636 /NCGR_PEP_ID=MMETSP0110_2-20121227/7250_1 /TAXON_ID=629695 /ORGANISM="Gymnochlora sp., Strain CCMP2014" /LENGTH=318 /DNA_ID=CAMNT_0007638277 /DNA_START=58 /DNA_END=1014 /DNA_ORIENTATION=+
MAGSHKYISFGLALGAIFGLVLFFGGARSRRVSATVVRAATPATFARTQARSFIRASVPPSPKHVKAAISRPTRVQASLQETADAVHESDKMLIAPSILSADFAKLGEEVDRVLASGADVVHFDVMDNHYVPNLTIGPMVCKALRDHGVTAPIDVHLMVAPVDRIIPDFISAGASYITFHPEATQHVDRSLQMIKDAGLKCGLVFNPATPLDILEYVIDKVDIVLLMSVNPGFGGQKFIQGTLKKAKQARKLIDEEMARSGRKIRLEIDGGVSAANIKECQEAGIDMFVAGSAIFNTPDYKETIDGMREALAVEAVAA